MSQNYYKIGIQDQNTTVGNETQVKQEGGRTTIFLGGEHCYNNKTTMNTYMFKRKITDIEDAIFTQVLSSVTTM